MFFITERKVMPDSADLDIFWAQSDYDQVQAFFTAAGVVDLKEEASKNARWLVGFFVDLYGNDQGDDAEDSYLQPLDGMPAPPGARIAPIDFDTMRVRVTGYVLPNDVAIHEMDGPITSAGVVLRALAEVAFTATIMPLE